MAAGRFNRKGDAMNASRRQTTLAAIAAMAAIAAAPLAHAQTYPSKQISVVSTASPGTSGDAGLRMIAAKMSVSLGQPIIVDLRTAARGAQAHAILSKAAPDGHTLMFGTAGTFVYSRFLFKNNVIDVLKDYAPISMSFNSPAYVAIHNSHKINTLQELIDFAKKNPGKLEFGSTGNGSYFHLAGEAVKHAAGIDILHVPYSQANYPQLQSDFLNGRIALFMTTWFNVGPNQARIKPLAIIDRQRSRHSPDVPIVNDVLPNFEPFVVWWGFFGPSGLPAPIANRIAAESKKAMDQPDVLPKLNDLGLEAVGTTPEELAKILRQDIAAIGKLVKAIGLQPE
jgi:tripartite-type tricarboxylate transporter receptor subunit TctC